MTTEIFRAYSGSHLYGTNLPESDRDFKGVFLPTKEEIILQKSPKQINNSTGTSESKNGSEDVDVTLYSLHNYMDKLGQGDMHCLEMLFSDPQYFNPEWDFIRKNAIDYVGISKKSFFGFVNAQHKRHFVRSYVINILRDIDSVVFDYYAIKSNKLSGRKTCDIDYVMNVINKHLNKYEDVYLTTDKVLFIGGKGYNLMASLKEFKKNLKNQLSKYGHRSITAFENGGIDWKAIMHGIRVAEQATEYFKHKTMTFPRPNADKLIKIRKGQLSYHDVENIFDKAVEDMEVAYDKSTIGKTDHKVLEDLVYITYDEIISLSSSVYDDSYYTFRG